MGFGQTQLVLHNLKPEPEPAEMGAAKYVCGKSEGRKETLQT